MLGRKRVRLPSPGSAELCYTVSLEVRTRFSILSASELWQELGTFKLCAATEQLAKVVSPMIGNNQSIKVNLSLWSSRVAQSTRLYQLTHWDPSAL